MCSGRVEPIHALSEAYITIATLLNDLSRLHATKIPRTLALPMPGVSFTAKSLAGDVGRGAHCRQALRTARSVVRDLGMEHALS